MSACVTLLRLVGRRRVMILKLSVECIVEEENCKINEIFIWVFVILLFVIDFFAFCFCTYVSPGRVWDSGMTVVSWIGADTQCPWAFSTKLMVTGLFSKARIVRLRVESHTLRYRI